jgi:hypothetical protein
VLLEQKFGNLAYFAASHCGIDGASLRAIERYHELSSQINEMKLTGQVDVGLLTMVKKFVPANVAQCKYATLLNAKASLFETVAPIEEKYFAQLQRDIIKEGLAYQKAAVKLVVPSVVKGVVKVSDDHNYLPLATQIAKRFSQENLKTNVLVLAKKLPEWNARLIASGLIKQALYDNIEHFLLTQDMLEKQSKHIAAITAKAPTNPTKKWFSASDPVQDEAFKRAQIRQQKLLEHELAKVPSLMTEVTALRQENPKFDHDYIMAIKAYALEAKVALYALQLD